MNLPTLSIAGVGKGTDLGKYVGLAIPILAILFAALITFFIVWPKFNEVMQLKTANKQLEELAQKLEAKANSLTNLNRDKLANQLTAAEQILPSDKGTFLMLRQLENIAGTTGALITRMDVTVGGVGITSVEAGVGGKAPVPPSPAQGPGALDSNVDAQKVEVKLTIASDYRGFLQFFNLLYAAPRAVTVNNLSIAASSANQLSTSLSLQAFWQSIPSELQSIESPLDDLTKAETDRLEAVASAPGAVGTVLPSVPLGRSDLFAPLPE